MCTRIDLGKDVGNEAVLIHDVGNPARKPSTSSSIRFDQDMRRIEEQRGAEASVISKSFVVCKRAKADSENLRVALRAGVVDDEEPAPFSGSPPGVGSGL